MQNTMAEQNVPAQAPTRTDEQIVPRSQWLQIGKSNLLFDAQKIQKNPIFQISVDILRNTNFFRAFSASASVPAIYIQQFWNSMKYDEKTGELLLVNDEQWFNLSVDLLRKALDITPVDPAHPFELPPTGDTVIDFVNQLGYPEPVEFVSNIRVNYVYQPWRAILTLINQTVMGRVYSRDSDILLTPSKFINQSRKDPKEESIPLLFLTGGDDFLLGNLKFISKGETDEVFGMAIPKQLITQAIQQSSYYPKYLEMVAKNTKKTSQDSASKQPEPATKQPVPQGEGDDPALELAKKMSLDAHQEKGEGEGADADIERAIKLSLDPSFLPQGQAPVGGVAIRDPVSETTPKLPEVVGKGKAIVTEEQVAHSLIDLSKKKSTTDQFILVRRDQAPHDSTTGPSSQPEDDTSEKVVHESSSTTDSENRKLDQTRKAHEALAGPDLEPMQEDQTGSDSGKVHVSLAGPNPEHMDEEFLATAYLKVHENLKLITDERVIEDNPKSHSGSIHQTVTTTLPEITPFIALQLRVAKLEQDMSFEVKKTDHSATVLASIKSQVPTVF
ncbi:hypothetical protein Tco_1056871 [Tanacetum coccineum]|uniref:Uncharacterized protein n=1 Tax=Tanacetum coccineum TaxID=301880 RepID=A0ABQ5H508_9ASTR